MQEFLSSSRKAPSLFLSLSQGHVPLSRIGDSVSAVTKEGTDVCSGSDEKSNPIGTLKLSVKAAKESSTSYAL